MFFLYLNEESFFFLTKHEFTRNSYIVLQKLANHFMKDIFRIFTCFYILGWKNFSSWRVRNILNTWWEPSYGTSVCLKRYVWSSLNVTSDLVLLEGPWSDIVNQHTGDSEADHILRNTVLESLCLLSNFSSFKNVLFCNQNQTSSFNKKKMTPAAAFGCHKYFPKFPTYPMISHWVLVPKRHANGRCISTVN